ncbi:hypothetical protein BSKO_07402 [Bryopsis sp. KO-2023]|nr:hypothetical protein BSKO_07402 [Bryopsis sp. KO-2023]
MALSTTVHRLSVSKSPSLTRRPIMMPKGDGAGCRKRGSVTRALGANEDHLRVAHKMADAAGRVVSSYFRTPVAIDTKGDESPVTIADRQSEAAMKKIIHECCPDHSIFGEEEGLHVGEGDGKDWLWVLDPIDGTKSFITGKPLFGTLIALLHKGVPVLGIMDQPISRERWVGVTGKQSQLNGKPIQTRKCPTVDSAYMYSTSPDMFQGKNWPIFEKIRDEVKMPLYGCDCYAYGLLSCGFCDLVVEADMKPYDYMALVPIVEGAGGRMTDWSGDPLVWDGVQDGVEETWPEEVVAAGDVDLHAQALEFLKPGKKKWWRQLM